MYNKEYIEDAIVISDEEEARRFYKFISFCKVFIEIIERSQEASECHLYAW